MPKPFEIHWNTDEEEAAINKGIAEDPDTYVMTDEEWAIATGKWRPGKEKPEEEEEA